PQDGVRVLEQVLPGTGGFHEPRVPDDAHPVEFFDPMTVPAGARADDADVVAGCSQRRCLEPNASVLGDVVVLDDEEYVPGPFAHLAPSPLRRAAGVARRIMMSPQRLQSST